VRILSGQGKPGIVYELGGPSIRTMREIMEFVLSVTQRHRILAPISFGVAAKIGVVSNFANKVLLGLVPDELSLTADQVELLKYDNIVSVSAIAEERTLEALGITAESIETIVPAYLYRFRKCGQFADQRAV
jgi:hypothetical protein